MTENPTDEAAAAPEDQEALRAWQLRKIEAGIAAADRGDFATDEEMAQLWSKFTSAR